MAITSYEPRGNLQNGVELATCPVGALHHGRGNPERVTFDSLTLCAFPLPDIKMAYGIDNFAREMLRAACGWDVNEEEWKDIVRRVSYMERCYSMREGYLPERDDILPERFFTETIYNKYGEPKKLNREEFMEWRKKLYLSLMTSNRTASLPGTRSKESEWRLLFRHWKRHQEHKTPIQKVIMKNRCKLLKANGHNGDKWPPSN